MTKASSRTSTKDLLGTFLDAAVTLHILELKRKGDPSDEDYAQMDDIAQLIGEKGDQILFKGKETAFVTNKLAYAVAVLSFSPGGITLFDRHWETPTDDESKQETT